MRLDDFVREFCAKATELGFGASAFVERCVLILVAQVGNSTLVVKLWARLDGHVGVASVEPACSGMNSMLDLSGARRKAADVTRIVALWSWVEERCSSPLLPCPSGDLELLLQPTGELG